MMRNLILLVFVLITQLLAAQNLSFDWAAAFGSGDPEYLYSMTVDKSGNAISTGYFEGTVDFDPDSVITYNLTAQNGIRDNFIQKLDNSGNLVWAKSFGSISNDRAHGITTDDTGNIYLTGVFVASGDFDPDPNSSYNLSSNGSFDVYVMKLDSTGNFLWAVSFGGNDGEEVLSIDLDASNNVIVTGYFRGTVDFDPGVSTYNISTPSTSRNTFIEKLDENGNFIWARTFSGAGEIRPSALKAENNGDIVITGTFSGTTDFDPGAGVFSYTSMNQTDNDVYVVKLDSAGNLVWAKAFGGTDYDVSFDLDIDIDGNIILAGWFRGTVDFNPGPATNNVTATGTYDIYVSKLNSQGNFVWVKVFFGSYYNAAQEVTSDRFGNIYFTGFFTQTVDFDPGSGVYNLTSNGGNDLFLEKIDKDGNFIWVHTIGGGSSQDGSEIFVKSSGEIYFAGHYASYTDLNPFSGTFYRNYRGGQRDMFVEKLDCPQVITIDSVVACDSYTWRNGQTYTVSNYEAEVGLQTTGGCDSIIQLHLTILNSTTSIDSIEACDSITWLDGNTYFTDNTTATFVTTNGVGCDSVITLNLDIKSSYQIDQITACDSLTWIDGNTYYASNNTAIQNYTNINGCDSTIALDLTINHSTFAIDSIVTCDSIIWIDGNTYYNSNNTASYILSNTNGCDSIVTLNLTVDTVNTNTTLSGKTISAVVANATYQWLDCNNSYSSIAGETSQSFIATNNGIYAVEITKSSGCSDTSACVAITTVGLDNVVSENRNYQIYPNPSSGKIFISSVTSMSYSIRVYSTQGKEVFNKHLAGIHNELDLNLAKGTYFLEVKSKNDKSYFKLILE